MCFAEVSPVCVPRGFCVVPDDLQGVLCPKYCLSVNNHRVRHSVRRVSRQYCRILTATNPPAARCRPLACNVLPRHSSWIRPRRNTSISRLFPKAFLYSNVLYQIKCVFALWSLTVLAGGTLKPHAACLLVCHASFSLDLSSSFSHYPSVASTPLPSRSLRRH